MLPTAIGPVAHSAPVDFNGTSAYSQNFETLSSTSASPAATPSSGMNDLSTFGSNGAGVAGWYVYGTAGWGLKWGVGNGNSNTGSFWGMVNNSTAANVTNHALGSQGSGNNTGFFGVVLKNTSGSTINSVAIGYDAVLNRNPTTTANPYPLSWLVTTSAAATAAGSAGAGTFNDAAGTWGSTSLGFTTPSTGTGAPSSTQTTYNSTITTFQAISGNLTGLNWAADSYLYLRWKDTDDAGGDSTAGIDNFSFAQLVARNLNWNVAGGGTWDTTVANWTAGSGTTTFAAGDGVTFANAAGGTITLAGSLAPVSVTISADSGTYTFSGSTAGDKITGAASIAKSGGGTAVFTSANDFTGGTTINAGTVRISADGQLGSGAVSLNGGALVNGALSPLSLTNAFFVGSGGGTVNTGDQNLRINGMSSLAGVLTKTGSGQLTLAGGITSGNGTGYNVTAGSLSLGDGPTSSGVYKVFASGTLAGNLIISGTQRFDVDGNAVISGPGKILVPTSGALISTTSGDSGGTVSSEIALNSGSAAFTAGSWSGGTYSPGTFTFTVGATKGATTSSLGALSVGTISGDSDVDLSNSSGTGGGGGQLTLTAQSTYTGNTTINTGTPDVAGTASIKLGIANALPATTGVIVGTKTGVGAAVLDMNGFDQQVAFLADGANVTASKFLTIKNNGTADSTLTLSGAVTAGAGFGGVIGTGATNKINVVKAGSNTQTLTGANTYNGTTTIAGGTLALAGGGSINASPVITVAAGAALDVSAVTGGYTLANGQTLGGNGTVVGAATLGGGSIVAPGAGGIGTLTMGDVTLGGGGGYALQMADATGGAGLGWDLISAGNVTLPGAGTFAITLSGAAAHFDTSASASWRILAASALSGSVANINVNASGFMDVGGGRFNVSDSGNAGTGLYLVFTPGQTLVWKGGDGAWTPAGGTDWSGGGWDSASTGVFNASAGTVTIDAGGVSAGRGLRFNETGYTIGGGALTLTGTDAAANTIDVKTGQTAIESAIGSSAGMTKAGSGTLVIAGDAAVTGGVTVVGGSLQVGNGATAGSLAGDVSLGAATSLVFNRSGATTYAGAIAGAGTVGTTGGDLTLAGNVGGVTAVANSGSAAVVLAGNVGDAVTITNSGPGSIALTGATVTTTGAVSVTGGRLSFGDAGVGSGAIGIGNGATLAFDGTTTKSFGNAITVAATGGQLEVATGDTLVLAGAVTRNGTLTKTGAGTVAVATLPTTNFAIGAGTLVVSATGTQSITVDLAGLFKGGQLAFSGSATRVNVNSVQTGAGAIVFTLDGQSLAVSGTSGTLSNPVALALASSAGQVNVGATSGYTLILNGAITGTGGVNFSVGSSGGAGTTVLNAASTFSGDVDVNSSAAGVHRLGIDNAIPATAGVRFHTNVGVIDLAGHNQRIASLASTTGTSSGGIVNSSTTSAILTIDGTANTSFAGRIGSSGSAAIAVVKAGSGTLSLTGTGTYMGATTITGGILAAGGSGIGDASAVTVAAAGTLQVDGAETIGSLAGMGGVTLNATLATGNDNSNTFFGGIAAGTGGLTKVGSGALTLAGVNTFTGATTVQAGTLRLANADALSSSAVTVAAGATLSVDSQVHATVAGLTNLGLVDVGQGQIMVAGGLSAGDVFTEIVSGFGDGSWNGSSGITSSDDGVLGGTRAVGWVDNGDGSVAFGYAAQGDTDLNGTVDLGDLLSILGGGKYGTGLSASWQEGDFNYDGVSDLNDLIAILGTGAYGLPSYNTPAILRTRLSLGDPLGPVGSFSAQPVAVPEPATATLLSFALVAMAVSLPRVRKLSSRRKDSK